MLFRSKIWCSGSVLAEKSCLWLKNGIQADGMLFLGGKIIFWSGKCSFARKGRLCVDDAIWVSECCSRKKMLFWSKKNGTWVVVYS